MTTAMMDRPCKHCGRVMKWDADPEEQCWRCSNGEHVGGAGSHREFETHTKKICYCPECYKERQSKERSI
jgi:hypothetical protein